MAKIKKEFEKVCNAYIEKLTKILDVDFCGWIGDEVGSVANFSNDMFLDFSNIKYFVDNNTDDN